MRPIPKKLLKEILEDRFYQKCCVTGQNNVRLHHNFIYSGKQVNEKWCILPLSDEIHDIEKRKDIKEILNWIMYNRATDEELLKYSKVVNYIERKEMSNLLFGKYKHNWYEKS